LQSAEGFIRQIIGWREYVWGLSWLWRDHIDANVLGHHRALPPVFDGASTDMACVGAAVRGVEERAWVHHIERLMVLSNLANLYGAEPRELVTWFADRFIDATGWVMVPNVIGMALWADGGRMASKPYVSGGAYINRMSDHCKGCRYDPKQRVGDDACPFTTLYWDFLARHRPLLARNGRMAQMLANLDRLSDLDATRAQAATTIDALASGRC
jgi:deoxyribodipyrimidine photolyase-related protein